MLLAFVLSLIQASCEHDDETFRCVQVLRNYDGDTLTVKIPGVHIYLGKNSKVRIRGIDAPEMKSKNQCERSAAKRARDYLRATLAKAKRVDLASIGRDKYHRILADVMADGQNVAELMLKEGLVVPYKGKQKLKTTWCREGDQ